MHDTNAAAGSDTSDRVISILVDQLGCDPVDVTPDALLVPEHDRIGRLIHGSGAPNLGCDSLDVVELVMTVEEEFGIEIPDDEAEPLNEATVQDLVDLIDAKRRSAD